MPKIQCHLKLTADNLVLLSDEPVDLAVSPGIALDVTSAIDALGGKDGTIEKDLIFNADIPVNLLFIKENIPIAVKGSIVVSVVPD